jgi:hypothetical protein
MPTKKQPYQSKPTYSTTTSFTSLERKVLRAWAEGARVSGDLLERCVDQFGSDWGIRWPVPDSYRWREADVVVGYILSFQREHESLLSIWGGWMCAGGLYFSLSDIDFLDRLALHYYDGFAECRCASKLSIFTTDAIRAENRRIIGEIYIPGEYSPWDFSEGTFVSSEEVNRWRREIFGGNEEDGEDEEDLEN